MSPHKRLIWTLCIVLHTPSADLCMGWVPPGGLGLPGTAAAPPVERVWGAPAGRPEHPDSSWRWCSRPRSSAGVTLRGVQRVECLVEVEREGREETLLLSLTTGIFFITWPDEVSVLWDDWCCVRVIPLLRSQQNVFIYPSKLVYNEARASDPSFTYW